MVQGNYQEIIRNLHFFSGQRSGNGNNDREVPENRAVVFRNLLLVCQIQRAVSTTASGSWASSRCSSSAAAGRDTYSVPR